MKHTKRLLTVLLMALLVAVLAIAVSAEGDVTIVDSGYCGAEGDGTNLTWTLDNEGTLIISGSGSVKHSFFDGFDNIINAVINEGVTDFSFVDCKNLVNVSIPNSITYIRSYQFDGCKSLTEIVIPDSVSYLALSAFSACKNVTVRIGKGVQEIDSTYGSYGGIKKIEVDELNPFFSSLDGVLFNKEQSELICYPCEKTNIEYIVPIETKKINSFAFFKNNYLKNLSFQEGLSELETGAVMLCPLIEDVLFPRSLSKIGEMNFVKEIVSPFSESYTTKAMDTEFNEGIFGSFTCFLNVPLEFQRDVFLAFYERIEPSEEIQEYLNNFKNYIEDPSLFNGQGETISYYLGTIRCHAGSTAEAYAIENNMNYELTHFYEGEWNYDWDNLVRWRKCIHCDERETEVLETETSGGAEIVGPVDGDISFDVAPVSTDYALVKEALGEMNVVKVFDISLKNNDGVHVQPKGTVKVKLPNDFKSESYKVYRINADGTYTDMNAFRQGSHLVFYTDHFSLYVIVDESAPSATDEPTEPATSDDSGKSEKDGFFQKLFAWLINLFNMFTRWIKK